MKNVRKMQFTSHARVSPILARFHKNELGTHIPINKEVISFQNRCGLLSQLWQGKGSKMGSCLRSLLRQHSTCCPRATGWPCLLQTRTKITYCW